MTRVFISYSGEDAKEAGVLHRLLSLLGFNCFLAHKDIRKGEQWREAIVRELRASEVFIPLLSESGLKSAWVHQECGMAHLLRGKKRRPAIIPVTLKGQVPPGCLSEYQAMNVGLTFWLSKLDIGHDLAGKLGHAIVEQVVCFDAVKPRAISNLSGTNLQDYCFVFGFLIASNGLNFDDFLTLIDHANGHWEAQRSDYVMHHMYRLLKTHYDEISKYPEWVKAWNQLHNRYQKHKDEQRRREEELARKMREQTEKLLERQPSVSPEAK